MIPPLSVSPRLRLGLVFVNPSLDSELLEWSTMPSNLLTQDRCVISFWKASCGSTARSAEKMSNAHRKHWTIHRSCYSNFTMGIYQTPLLEMICKTLWRLGIQARSSDPFHYHICSWHILGSMRTLRGQQLISDILTSSGLLVNPVWAFQADA